MKLLRKSDVTKLRANANRFKTGGVFPVVKFFYPAGAGTWLFTELDEDGDTLFGLCDPGHGTPELGTASLSELASFRGRFGLGIERDMHFKPNKTLAAYAEEASNLERIDA